MNFYLNAGFGDPLPEKDLELILSLGYTGIRQDLNSVDGVAPVVSNVLGAMAAIFVVPVDTPMLCQTIAHALAPAIVASGFQQDAVIEVGNEEDLGGKRWHKDPAGWAQLVSDVLSISREHEFNGDVISGGVSSLSKDAMRWLEQSRVSAQAVGIGYHQYRSTPPQTPLKGYPSRELEFAALKRIAGPSDVWCTECGWTTTPHSEGWGPFKRTWSYSDAEVAKFLSEEIKLNEVHNAKCFTTYQLNDGPDPANDQDRFGIRTVDGALKPSAYILREA